jgi:putative phosphotransacetylase
LIQRQKSSCSDYKYVDIISDIISNEIAAAMAGNTNSFSLNDFNEKKVLIPLGISNHHIHLTKKTFAKLFGEETEFKQMKPLYQPGEFASIHTLTIAGPKMRSIQNIRILGPLRSYDQVEVSLTDAIFLGINPPVTNSGSLDKAEPLTLIGPKGAVYLERCAIIANRHIHMTSQDAKNLNVKNGDFCKVRLGGDKSSVLENVLVRTNDNWKLQIHLDTDDANAANIREETQVEFLGKM